MAEPDDDLRDDLQLQEILLASLAGTEEDTPQRRAEIKAEIVRVKTELKRLQVARQKQDLVQHSGTASYSAGNIANTMAGPSRNEQSSGAQRTRDRPNAYSDRPNASSISGMPFYSENIWGEASNNESARKRTYSTHLDNGQPTLPGPKSQRTEENELASLFGEKEEDDGLAWRYDYAERELAFREKQTQEESDAAMARQMQEELDELARQESLPHSDFNNLSEPHSDHLDHDQSQPIESPAPSEPRETQMMPGSWEPDFNNRDFDNTDFDNFIDLTDDQPSHGFVPARGISASSAGNVHSGQLAHHAEIQRQRLENGSPFPRTNNYNYENGTNEFGGALDGRIVMPAGYEESDQVKALLANISTDTSTTHSDQECDGTPPALKEPLYKHQQIALKWMKGMEADIHKHGGLLADDMGLGKTISMLALMVHDLKPHGDNTRVFSGTNVVVAPVSLIRQWEKEIKDKLKHTYRLKVHNYHKKKLSYDELRHFDVVVTSYGKLATELKALDAFTKNMFSQGQNVDKDILAEKFPFICPKDPFLRLVLDESQQIKNKNTQMHRAVCRVPTKYRWCLSGTPMMNNVDEMGSHIHFLQIKPYNDPQEFRRKFAALYPRSRSYEDPDKVMKRLQALLRAIMLRRTKASKIDGDPIITLPPKTEVIDYVTFGPDEQQYYDDLARDARVMFSKFLRAGTVGKHYRYILERMLRMRQACCHPYLHLTDMESMNVAISENEMATLAKEIHATRVDALKEEVAPMECPICYEFIMNPSILIPCGHYACLECLQLHTSSSEQRNQIDNEAGKPKCIICRADFDMKRIITYQTFRNTFMPESVGDDNTDESEEDDADSDETDSAEDGDGDDIDERGNLKGFIVDDEDDEEYKPQPKSHKDKGKSKANGKNKTRSKKKKKKEIKKPVEDIQPHMLAKLRKEAGRNAAKHKMYMDYLKSIWETSAKVAKCVEVLKDIQESGEKTIVFSQWTLLLDLLEVPLRHDLKLRFRRYDGSMSAKLRDDAVHEFTDNADTKVLLTSLKAGNAGLNLVCASRVIILDPFWNPFIEKQAVDRTYRIGQRKPVKVHRILIKDTIEDRIVNLQEQKRELVEGAMDEKVAKDLGRLSQSDLAYLFGVGGR
ncbi:uncharacterized protein PG998_011043 [Apiospora kogelbergensis]|uniref:uncharacterized protein n=1 Tax=Apiospora kogelbergensis TaxID=1337665 RepID=UPI0031313E67